jgi:hypothetical protein
LFSVAGGAFTWHAISQLCFAYCLAVMTRPQQGGSCPSGPDL